MANLPKQNSKLFGGTAALPLFVVAHAQPLEEVSFITSSDSVTLEMLSIAGVKRGDYVINLGSSDGRAILALNIF